MARYFNPTYVAKSSIVQDGFLRIRQSILTCELFNFIPSFVAESILKNAG